MSGINFNDTDRVAERYDIVRVIREESDFPDPILAPDGVMRTPLDITTSYVFDVGEITVSRPFLVPKRLLGFERARLQCHTNVTINYAGTDTFFWGRGACSIETDKTDFVALIPGTKFFDLIAGINVVNMTIFNTAIVDFDMGYVSGYAFFGRRLGIDRPLGNLQINSSPRCFIDNVRLTKPNSFFTNPYFLFTGGDATTNVSIENVLLESPDPGQSVVAVDSGFEFKQVSLQNIAFDDSLGGGFFPQELSGSITSFSDISVLISGNPTSYEDDGSGSVLVTDTGHDVYVGLTVIHTLTTSYNGTFIVTDVLGLNQYVMNATYVSDEVSGNYVGRGTRVETSIDHEVSINRGLTLSGTGVPAYDGSSHFALSVTNNQFDIAVEYVSDPGTGNYSVTSLDQTDPRIRSVSNGDLADSKKTGEVDLSVPITVSGTGTGTFVQIGGTNWTSLNLEEFTATSSGELIYIGQNKATFTLIGTATLDKASSSSILSLRIAKGITTIPSSEGATENSTGTQVSSLAIIEMNTNEKVTLFTANTGTNSGDVIVKMATLLVSGK